MTIEINDVIRHAVMAEYNNEIKSIVILMVTNSDPELHMAVHSDTTFAMNAAVDMLKIEMLKLLTARAESKGKRE